MAEQGYIDKEIRNQNEKWPRRPFNAITLAALFIWGGLVLLAETMDLVPAYWWNGWAVFLAGGGLIVLLQAPFRAMVRGRRRVAESLVLGFILLGIGAGGLIGWKFVWPVVLIVIGIVILLRTSIRRR